jgi:predicted NBD/HSP70 family sugar kinase
MGRDRRGGYIFIWWIGDHRPRHVHVFDNDGRIITRVNLETMQPMDVEKIDSRIVELINELREEGRF